MKTTKHINKLICELAELERKQGNRKINPPRLQNLLGVNQATVNRWMSGEVNGGLRAVRELKLLIRLSEDKKLNEFEMDRDGE
jgi:hypothetical protein